MKHVRSSRWISESRSVGCPRLRRFFVSLLLPVLGVAGSVALAHDTGTTPAPGYRPDVDVDREHAFVDSLKGATVLVLPTVVRSIDGVGHDFASAALIREILCMDRLAGCIEYSTTALSLPTNAGGGPQFELFQRVLESLGTSVAELRTDADYVLMLELLISPRRRGGEAVGGIHCFVLNREGKNVFSFLLNSHHRILIDAGLRTEAVGGGARADLVARATRVACEALWQQIAAAAD